MSPMSPKSIAAALGAAAAAGRRSDSFEQRRRRGPHPPGLQIADANGSASSPVISIGKNDIPEEIARSISEGQRSRKRSNHNEQAAVIASAPIPAPPPRAFLPPSPPLTRVGTEDSLRERAKRERDDFRNVEQEVHSVESDVADQMPETLDQSVHIPEPTFVPPLPSPTRSHPLFKPPSPQPWDMVEPPSDNNARRGVLNFLYPRAGKIRDEEEYAVDTPGASASNSVARAPELQVFFFVFIPNKTQ